MIGDDSTVVGSSGSPMSTGKVPSFVHASTAARANSGGSRSEMNRASSECRSVCTATSERRMASSRGTSVSAQSVTFSTVTRSVVSG